MGNSLNNENFWQLVTYNQLQSILADSHRIVGCYGNHSAKSEEVLKLSKKNKKQGAPHGRTLPKSTHDSDMYNRAFPIRNALFLIAGGMMSLLRLPRGKLPLAFLAVPAGKDGRVECPCQTVNDFIGIGEGVCALKTQAAIKRQGLP